MGIIIDRTVTQRITEGTMRSGELWVSDEGNKTMRLVGFKIIHRDTRGFRSLGSPLLQVPGGPCAPRFFGICGATQRCLLRTFE